MSCQVQLAAWTDVAVPQLPHSLCANPDIPPWLDTLVRPQSAKLLHCVYNSYVLADGSSLPLQL